MKSNLAELKQHVHSLLKELERIEAKELEDKDIFPLSELRERVTRYTKDNGITIDTFCELAMISKATLYAAFNSPGSAKCSTIESIIAVFGDYTLYVGRTNAS